MHLIKIKCKHQSGVTTSPVTCILPQCKDMHDALEKMFVRNMSRDVIEELVLMKVRLSKISWHGKHTYSDVLIKTKLD